jgi:hypothetical protein
MLAYVLMGTTDERDVLGWPVLVFTDRETAVAARRFSQRDSDEKGITLDGMRIRYYVWHTACPLVKGLTETPGPGKRVDMTEFLVRRAISLKGFGGEE